MKNYHTLSFISILGFVVLLNLPQKIKLKKEFVEFDKGKFACIYEVSNKEYKLFLNSLLNSNRRDLYEKAMYDSNGWTSKFPKAMNEPLRMNYHWHPAYDDYPIVNITFEGAKMYCEWLSKSYQGKEKLKFRLPNEKEWRKISSPLPGHNLPWVGLYAYESSFEKQMLANVKFKDYVNGGNDYLADGAVYTNPVATRKPNRIGIYNIIGNAAEMTSDGKIKGGSWDNFVDDCTIDNEQNFQVPDPRVGFRIMYELE